MAPWSRSRPSLTRLALLGAGATVATQVVVASGVVVADEIRKRRKPPTGEFPRVEPHTHTVGDSALTTYTYGGDLYAEMIDAIEAATDHVYFESYIVKGDEVGRRFKDALVAAAQRGVRVHVIFDDFANIVVPPPFKRWPQEVHVLRFPVLRPGMITLNMRHFGRDHRKILTVDARIGFVGGYNIGRLYETSWRDTHLKIEGPAVWELENAFVDFWNRYRGRHQPALPDRGARQWDARILAQRNAPSRMVFPVRGMYLDAIDRATERIWITQAYFIPDAEILEALKAASARGVDVKVILPESSNHVIADWVARGYWTELLQGGIELHLFQNAMVHAKTATIDGRWATIGTANVDRLSMRGNYEINMEVYDRDVAAHMEEVFRTDLTSCRQMTADEWRRRGLVSKVSERVLSPLHPLM